MELLPLEDFKGSQTIRYGTAATSASANKAPIFIKNELNQLYNYVRLKFSEAPFDWDARKTYEIGEVVSSNGKVYKAIAVNGNQEPPSGAWALVNTDALNLELKYVQIQSDKYISLENRNSHKLMSVRNSNLSESDNGNSTDAIMTPKNGLVPYDNGLSSYLGTSVLKFKESNIKNGKFNEIHSTTGNITTLTASKVTASTFIGTATNADKLDGHDSSNGTTANTVVVRKSNGQIAGTIDNANKLANKSLSTAASASVVVERLTNGKISGTIANADKLSNKSLSVNATANTVVLRDSNGHINGKASDADLLDGHNSSVNATANTVVLRDNNGHINGKASDADKLDGLNSSQFIRNDITQDVHGTLNLKVNNAIKLNVYNESGSKSSEFRFNSYGNLSSDYGYLRYYDDDNNYNKWGDSAENSAMILGVVNDTRNSNSDVVALESPAGIFLNAPDVYVGDKTYLHNMHAANFYGTSSSAKYADLAEKYTSDIDYDSGTVLGFGGDNEVTLYNDTIKLAGVVSTDPGYILNSELDGVHIALKGRVPCKIIGDAVKGQYIIASNDGYGIAVDDYTFEESKKLLGIAISDSENNVVEIKV